jgi:hypothetical protein
MKKTTIEICLFACMLVSTLVILLSMGMRDINICLISFATFLIASITLIVKLKK